MTNQRQPLVAARRVMNLSQDDVARTVGVTRQFYGMVEAGLKKPSIDVALRIAALFERPVEELFADLLDDDQAATLDPSANAGLQAANLDNRNTPNYQYRSSGPFSKVSSVREAVSR